MDGFAEMFRGQGLPEAGSVVRCRRTNSLWRVMEREVWHWVEEPPEGDAALVVPSSYLSFWRIEAGVPPGVGQMLDIFITSTTIPSWPTGKSSPTTEPRWFDSSRVAAKRIMLALCWLPPQGFIFPEGRGPA